MIITLELHIRKQKVDCLSIGPTIAPYGININKVVDELNKLLVKGQIAINSKVPIEIDMETRRWHLVLTQKKMTEQLKDLAINGKIKYSDLENYVIRTYKTINQLEIDKKIKELQGTCKSMHLEIVK